MEKVTWGYNRHLTALLCCYTKLISLVSFASLSFCSLSGGGCDNRVSEPADDDGSITFTEAPIIYPNSSQHPKGDLTQSKAKSSGARYYCLVSTLNPEGTEFAYVYHKYDLTIPKGLLKQARRDHLDDKWVTFALGSKYATVRTEADPLDEGGALVRMARCRMPASTHIIDAIERSMNQFGSASWVDKQHKTKKSSTRSSKNNPRQSEIVCTEYTLHWICQEPGVTDPAHTEGCVFISAECTRYEVISDGGLGGGGGDPEDGSPGGGPSGNGGDICHPESSGPGSPGLMGTGGGLTDPDGVPVSCNAEGDPCEQVEELENDTTWVGKLEELLEAANTEDSEEGYLRKKQADGSFSYEHVEGSGDATINLNDYLNGQYEGYIHSHYEGTLSIFSPADLRTIYQMYQRGNIQDIQSFTAGVVSHEGSTYLLKVSDLDKFLNFGNSYLSSQSSFNTFNYIYNSYISVNSTVSANEKGFLQMLNQINSGNGTGLKLFKGDTDNFDSWQAKKISPDNYIVDDNCN